MQLSGTEERYLVGALSFGRGLAEAKRLNAEAFGSFFILLLLVSLQAQRPTPQAHAPKTEPTHATATHHVVWILRVGHDTTSRAIIAELRFHVRKEVDVPIRLQHQRRLVTPASASGRTNHTTIVSHT